MLVPILIYGSETMLGKEKERLLAIRRIDRVPNALIRELCGVKKNLDERIDEGVLRWFGYVERMERDRIAKRVYVGECAGSRSVGRPQKRWIDSVKERVKKSKQGEFVQDRSGWRRVCEGMNPSS